MPLSQDAFMEDLVAQLHKVPPEVCENELPSYNYGDTEAVADLLSGYSSPQAFYLGTGASVFASALLPAILEARREIIFVTCFWAPSKSLRDLSRALARLAAARHRDQPILRVYICLSSRSFLQKLLHPSDANGYTYPPGTWESQLGLPSPEVLRAGRIELTAKSLFFLPLSVMHSKYMIVDRERAFLPSCNVSWEPWLEGCVEVKGEVVRRLVQFHIRMWESSLHPLPVMDGPAADLSAPEGSSSPSPRTTVDVGPLDANGPGSIVVRFSGNDGNANRICTDILPSSHHRNPQFRPFFWQDSAPIPRTPLNLGTIQLLSGARHQIYIQTPNLTCEAVIAALLAALGRGVSVTIVTCEGMMVYEQLLTALTTTARCIRSLVERHEAQRGTALRNNEQYGHLQIAYFQPLSQRPRNRRAASEGATSCASYADVEEANSQRQVNDAGFAQDTDEPVQSHVKLTIVDGTHTILGSGNMDRASFFTSQELGIVFHSAPFASAVQMAVDRVLDGRLKPVYPV